MTYLYSPKPGELLWAAEGALFRAANFDKLNDVTALYYGYKFSQDGADPRPVDGEGIQGTYVWVGRDEGHLIFTGRTSNEGSYYFETRDGAKSWTNLKIPTSILPEGHAYYTGTNTIVTHSAKGRVKLDGTWAARDEFIFVVSDDTDKKFRVIAYNTHPR
jgi:hypothetical protein